MPPTLPVVPPTVSMVAPTVEPTFALPPVEPAVPPTPAEVPALPETPPDPEVEPVPPDTLPPAVLPPTPADAPTLPPVPVPPTPALTLPVPAVAPTDVPDVPAPTVAPTPAWPVVPITRLRASSAVERTPPTTPEALTAPVADVLPVADALVEPTVPLAPTVPFAVAFAWVLLRSLVTAVSIRSSAREPRPAMADPLMLALADVAFRLAEASALAVDPAVPESEVPEPNFDALIAVREPRLPESELPIPDLEALASALAETDFDPTPALFMVVSCPRIFWTPICPTGGIHDEVEHDPNRNHRCE